LLGFPFASMLTICLITMMNRDKFIHRLWDYEGNFYQSLYCASLIRVTFFQNGAALTFASQQCTWLFFINSFRVRFLTYIAFGVAQHGHVYQQQKRKIEMTTGIHIKSLFYYATHRNNLQKGWCFQIVKNGVTSNIPHCANYRAYSPSNMN
jgi:hypothetical protein